ncbi:UNVERIFIED_CONTAM: hypothetical protein K2H54_016038 [Gekko kuhli]
MDSGTCHVEQKQFVYLDQSLGDLKHKNDSRADKEEQCLDPAKAPLSPTKRSPGRKYFKRKSRKKQTEDETEAGKIKENERKIQTGKQNRKETATHPREPVTKKTLMHSTGLLRSREVIPDLVKTQLRSEANCDSCTGAGAYASNRRGSRSEEKETWLNEELGKRSEKDISSSSTQKEELFHAEFTGKLTFQKNSDGLHFKQKPSSNSLLVKLYEESASFRNADDSSEEKNSENLDHFEFQNQNGLVFSNCGCPSFAEENVIFSISPNRSKVNML